MAGYNVCIFAYGQTGAGKSYTMMGKQVRDCGSAFNNRTRTDLGLIAVSSLFVLGRRVN